MTENSHAAFEKPIDVVMNGVRKIVDRVAPKPEAPSRWAALASRATRAIKAHPIAAVAIAVGAGFLVVRILRR